MNMLLLAGTVLGVGVLTLGAIVSLFMAAPLRSALLGGAAALWSLAYAVALIGTSMASHEATLAPGETKEFCGFYFDCHVGVAVVGHEEVQRIGNQQAAGAFHIITLRFSSSARREPLAPWHVRVELQAPAGLRYARDLDAENALDGHRELERVIAPGGAYEARVVFDAPRGASGLRLFADQGPSVKFPELLLIGDEASLMHAKTWLALQ
jgi:hypothetical protein